MQEFGHVFVARGDLLSLACDAIVVPTDGAGQVEAAWRHHLGGLDGVVLEGGRVRLVGADPSAPVTVAGPFAPPTDGGSQPASSRRTWLVTSGVLPGDAGIGPEDAQWGRAIADLERVLQELVARFRASQRDLPRPARGCPLVGVPLLGSAAGGFRNHFRPYAEDLIRLLRDAARAGGFDVALVIYGHGERAAAFEAVCRLERRELDDIVPTLDGLAERWELGDEAPRGEPRPDDRTVDRTLRTLVEKARSGELVPFFGAGVSRSAGALGWGELIGALKKKAGLTGLRSADLDLLARAQIVENSLGTDRLHAEIVALLREAQVSLQHLLLASFAPRDAITTNFDDAYERAIEDSGRGEVAVVPRPGSTQRLLKLHGSLPRAPQQGSGDGRTDGEGALGALPPILTRDQFLEHERQNGPLRGALQMLLLTGHVLFIGYSLNDPDLHAAIHEVRHIRELANLPAREPLATAVQVEASPELSYLWAPTVDVLWPAGAEAEGSGEGADGRPMKPRELEILLDALADEASSSELPVLAFKEHELTGGDKALHAALTALQGLVQERPLPPPIADLLATYGMREASASTTSGCLADRASTPSA
jgi:hypothetical protein